MYHGTLSATKSGPGPEPPKTGPEFSIRARSHCNGAHSFHPVSNGQFLVFGQAGQGPFQARGGRALRPPTGQRG